MSAATAFHANLRRGQLLRQTGRYQEACEYLGAAIQLDPERPEPYLELALAQSEMPGRKADALRSIDRALALDPESGDYLGWKAYLLARYGRNQEALEFARRALEIAPWCHIALLAQANVHTHLGEWDKAEEIARRMLEFDAEDTTALNLLAQTLRFQHRYAEARVVLGQLLARMPEDAFGLANAGYEALAVGDYRRANEHFLSALRLEPKSKHARQGLLQSLRHRVWIYRVQQQVYHLLSGGPHHGRGFRLALIVLTIGTGGLFLGVIIFFALIGMTIQPVSDFFLLFDPMGRRALTTLERRSSLFVGAVAAFFLVLIACSGYPHLVMGIGCYLAIFALCVLIPQWVDAWHSRQARSTVSE
jgi:tetratricopeptide (TPR) repeat protein